MSTDYAVLADFNYSDEGFQSELQAEIVDKLALTNSGVLTQTNLFDTEASGSFLNITQYPTVADAPQQVISGSDLDVRDFNDYKQRAAWLLKADAFGVENLVNIMAKKDPIGELLRQLSNTVSKAIQSSALNAVKGIMATALSTTHSTGSTYSGAEISYEAILAAKQLLGDAQMQLTKAICHSKVINNAAKMNIASFGNGVLGANSAVNGNVPVLAGMETWMDDTLAAVASVYSSFFASPGALVYGFGGWERNDLSGNKVKSATVDIEFGRNQLSGGGVDLMFYRFKSFVHPLGMSYTSATANPTDAQLATGSNWTYVADDVRKIKIVELKTA